MKALDRRAQAEGLRALARRRGGAARREPSSCAPRSSIDRTSAPDMAVFSCCWHWGSRRQPASCSFSTRESSAPWSKTRRLGSEWSISLEALGIDPAIYLWEGSPCAFPGVRRYAGSTEIAVFRKRTESSEAPPQCLSLDDNDYPKHLWSFVFTGKPFRKRGPDGYQLAHLFDHKEYGNRWRDELDAPPGVEEPVLPYGLFTSAANAVYAPGAFLRPTDLSPRLRSLIQRRAQQLYGNILLPGAAAPGGKILRRPELGRRRIPVERACGQHGARSRFPGIPPRAHRRTHRNANAAPRADDAR